MDNRPNNNKRARDIGFYALILIVLMAVIFSLAGGNAATPTYSQVIDLFENQRVESFAIKGNRLDLYMPTLEEAFAFGVHNATVYFLD